MKILRNAGIVLLVILALLSGVYILGRDSDRVYPETIRNELTDVDGIFNTVLDSSFMAPLFTEGFLSVDETLINSGLYYIMATEQEMLDADEVRINYVYTEFSEGDLYIKAHVDLKKPFKYPTTINIHMDIYGQGQTVGAKLSSVSLGHIPIPKGLIRFVVKRSQIQGLISLYLPDELSVDYDGLSAEVTIDQLRDHFAIEKLVVSDGSILVYGATDMQVGQLLSSQSIPESYLELADLVVGVLSSEGLTSNLSDVSKDEVVVLTGIESLLIQSQESGLSSLKVADLATVYFTLSEMDDAGYQSLLTVLDTADQPIVKLLVEELRAMDYTGLLNRVLDSIL